MGNYGYSGQCRNYIINCTDHDINPALPFCRNIPIIPIAEGPYKEMLTIHISSTARIRVYRFRAFGGEVPAPQRSAVDLWAALEIRVPVLGLLKGIYKRFQKGHYKGSKGVALEIRVPF